MMFRFAIILCAALISAEPTSGPTTAPAPTYAVHLDTDRVGLKQDVSVRIDYTRNRSARRNEKTTWSDKDKFQLEFEGTFEVLATKDGNATKLAMTVERFDLTKDGKSQPVVPGGSVILIESNGEAQPNYTHQDGEEIDSDMLWYVQMLARVHRDGEPTSTDLYGKRGAHAIGASWRVNLRQLAKAFAVQSMVLQPDSSSGTVTLSGVEQRDGATYAHLQVEMAVDLRVASLAKGWKQTSGPAYIRVAKLFPTEPTGAALDSSSVYDGKLTFVRPVGKNGAEREASEDHIVRLTEVKVRRTYPTTSPTTKSS